MPDGFPSGGPYKTPPSAEDERIADPIRRGRPEEITGLAWIKPDFSASGHKLVRLFAIDRKVRPGRELIRCAMCSNAHPKFLDGAVLWSPDGYLRVIGHVCAAKPEHFGEAGYQGLRRQRNQEELDAAAFDWLQAHIGKCRSLIPVVERLKANALFLEAQQHILFRDVPELARLLSLAAHQHGGSLTVVQDLSGTRMMAAQAETGMRQDRYELVNIGELQGAALLGRPRSKRSRQLDGILEALDRAPPGDGEASMLALIERGEHELTITAGIILRAMQRAIVLAGECAEAEKFFSMENLAALEKWGQDPRNTIRFSVQRSPAKITLVLQDRSRASLSTVWPKPADLSAFRAIEAVSAEFGKLWSRATSSA